MDSLWHLAASIIGLGIALFVLERFVPLRKATHALLARLAVNLTLGALAIITAAAVVRPAVLSVMRMASHTSFGLLQLVSMPIPLQFVIGFLLMDLTFYYWHLANHQVPLLWRFHNVHHIDPDLDVSTAVCFHIGEVALSAGFRFIQMLLIGVSPGIYAAYEAVFQANTLFHHSNVRLDIRVERWMNTVLVTPRMHGIHHSQVQEETTANFSVVFPWWDRLHRTLRLNIPQSAIAIGIPGYSAPEDNTLWHTLSMPFRRQRNYWRRPDGTAIIREPAIAERDRTRLAA